MKKIIVIGCPGSGKSTFARRLRDITNLPLFYLDMIYHKSDKTTVSREEFDSRLDEILKNDNWIIDGNYKRTMRKRLENCDTVFWLDYPTELCLESVFNRIGIEREDMPWNDEVEPEFVEYVKNFKAEQNPVIENLIREFSDRRIIVFHSREESDEFLRNIKE